ncbi:MAG: hypothetical protein AB7G44_09645 [Bacteroidia bacterium]
MANITDNLLNTSIPAAGLAAVQTGITGIATVLDPITHTLIDEQRESLLSLNVDNKVFVEEALVEITTNGAILPSAVNAAFLANDLLFFNQLSGIETQLENLLIRIKDTKRLAGHEAYAMALTIYTLYKALAAAGVPGAQQSADKLGERFNQQGGGAPAPQNP